MAAEPYDGNENDKNSLYQGRDRVRDRGDEREENEGEDVLRKVENPVEEEFQREIDGGMSFGGSEKWGIVITLEERREEGKPVGPEPDWGGEEKGETGAVAEEVEFVKFSGLSRGSRTVGFCAGGFVEECLGEDVLGHEDYSSTKGAEDTEEISREFYAASKDNAHSQRDQRKIGGFCVTDIEDETIGENGK